MTDDAEQRAALDAVAGAEHLDDLTAAVGGRKLGEALARLGPLDPDVEADIAAALAMVGVPYPAANPEVEALAETEEILADPALMAALREGEADVAAGRILTDQEVADLQRRHLPDPRRAAELAEALGVPGGLTAGWTRDQRRSLWIAAAVAGRIVVGPGRAREIARRNLTLMRKVGGAHARTSDFDEWEVLLGGPLEELLAVLLATTERSRDLRQQNPFAGLISDDERQRVLNAFRAAEGRPPLEGDPDAALIAARLAADMGARTDLDDAIRELGYDRNQLEAENAADARDARPFVVEVVRSGSHALAVAIPEPAEQVAEVGDLAEVEPLARAVLAAALGVPGATVPILILVDSLNLPGVGPQTSGRAILITDDDEAVIANAAALLEQGSSPWAEALEATGGSLTDAERSWADDEIGGGAGVPAGTTRLAETIRALLGILRRELL